MWFVFEKAVFAMAALRILSGIIEMSAGLLMLKLNDLEKAMAVNASLALIGPVILVSTMTIGIFGLVDRVSFTRMTWIAAGVACILLGIKST